MPTQGAEDSRLELLAAAQRGLRRDGFAHLTLREVAREVGVAHSLVRHYFGTRDRLLAEAFDLAAATDQPSMPSPGDDASHLERLVHRTQPMDRDHYLMWIDAWSEAPRSPELKRTLRRWEDDCQRSLATLLAEAVDAGEIEVDDDVLRTATRINAVIDGLAIQHHATARLTEDELHEQIRRALEQQLRLPDGTLALRPVIGPSSAGGRA